MSVGHAIGAVVAAAGCGTRMGAPKQLLPWDGSTVIAVTVDNLVTAGADPVIVVIGHMAPDVTAALKGTRAVIVTNTDYASSELLQSFQAGLRQLSQHRIKIGALLGLGDQPHVPPSVARQIMDEAQRFPAQIVVPSHGLRRGHPMFLPVSLWDEVLALGSDATLRAVLERRRDSIRYVNVSTPAILRDIDTPDDYEMLRPR